MPTSPDALPLSVRLFGPLEVRLQGQSLRPLRTRRGEWLLALLALRRNQPLERAWLAGTLWPESDHRQGAESPRRTLTDLRQALGTEAGRILSPTAHTLSLHLTEAEADVIAFDQAFFFSGRRRHTRSRRRPCRMGHSTVRCGWAGR